MAARKTKAKKKATKSRAKKAAAREVVIVGSKVKAAIKANGCNTGGDALEALNGKIHDLIEQACGRATSNGRKTVRAHDV